MRPTLSSAMAAVLPLLYALMLCVATATVTLPSERRLAANGSPMLVLLRGLGSKPLPIPPPPAGPPGWAKEAAAMAMEPKGAEILPKPLPQIMPRNLTDAMKPPLGAAQVAPPEKLVNMDVCRGYYDVMGQYDLTFNCSKGTFIYCCGTCHYRFCCEHSRNRLDQDSCTNYNTPDWANTHVSTTPPPGWGPGPTFDPVRTQSNTAYVIGGVLSFTLAAAVGMKVVFHKMSRRPHNREINMPRALVDILRHQSSPVQQGERNNSTILTTATSGEGKLGRPPKKLYTPVLPSKDNRLGNVQHNLGGLSGSSPKHTATIERAPRMNNVQLAPTGTLLSSKHGSMGRPPSSLSHSFHNLAQLPPSYEVAMRPDISRYCSLKRLEKDLEDYSTMGYSTSKRRPNNMPPSFHSSQHHLHWGGDYTLGARGTLPLHSSRSRIHLPATPNPYPLPPSQSAYHPGMEPLSHPPRRVMSQDQLLMLGEGNTLSRLSKNQQHQYYKAMTTSKSSTGSTLRRSHERLLVSPDRLDERVRMPTDFGMPPTLPRLTSHQKAQSQQNVCVTPSMDRHHMIKMNSHPSSGRDMERSHPTGGTMGWAESGHGSSGGGGGTLGHNARRMAFATKRQNTIEQLHYIPVVGGGGNAGQSLRTGSKNEVTV
ncbi:protein shisa-7 isoform X1 [Alosa sapidissima]|uniref:protein shisa-7 isoform X1 n=1 Tax=Alosa sapidissima TaxID=34773 RepID=UPI001C083830|nr:protein shisa-7 isoform X1 [Alosa sapidissima]